MRPPHLNSLTLGALLTATSGALAGSYSSPGGPIPDNLPATPLVITFNVTDVGPVSHVDLTLMGLSHTWAGDLIVTLTGPGGSPSADIMRRAEDATAPFGTFGDSSNLLGDYRFIDTGANLGAALGLGADAFNLTPGDYQASTRATTTAPNTPVMLDSLFSGVNATGTWTLRISDNAAGDAGSIAAAVLNVVVPTPGAALLLALAGIVTAGRRRTNRM